MSDEDIHSHEYVVGAVLAQLEGVDLDVALAALGDVLQELAARTPAA